MATDVVVYFTKAWEDARKVGDETSADRAFNRFIAGVTLKGERERRKAGQAPSIEGSFDPCEAWRMLEEEVILDVCKKTASPIGLVHITQLHFLTEGETPIFDRTRMGVVIRRMIKKGLLVGNEMHFKRPSR